MDDCVHGKDKARHGAQNNVIGELNLRVTSKNIQELEKVANIAMYYHLRPSDAITFPI